MLLSVGEYKTYNIIDIMKSLRETHNINESWVCQRCPQREKCQMKDQPPNERHTHLNDLVKGLYSLSLAERGMIGKLKGDDKDEEETEAVSEEQAEVQGKESSKEGESGLLSDALNADKSIGVQTLSYKEWSSILKVTDTLDKVLDDLYNNHGIDTKTFLTEFKEYQRERQRESREYLNQQDKVKESNNNVKGKERKTDAQGKTKIQILQDDDEDDDEVEVAQKNKQSSKKSPQEEVSEEDSDGEQKSQKGKNYGKPAYARQEQNFDKGQNYRRNEKFQNRRRPQEWEERKPAMGEDGEGESFGQGKTYQNRYDAERPRNRSKYREENYKNDNERYGNRVKTNRYNRDDRFNDGGFEQKQKFRNTENNFERNRYKGKMNEDFESGSAGVNTVHEQRTGREQREQSGNYQKGKYNRDNQRKNYRKFNKNNEFENEGEEGNFRMK